MTVCDHLATLLNRLLLLVSLILGLGRGWLTMQSKPVSIAVTRITLLLVQENCVHENLWVVDWKAGAEAFRHRSLMSANRCRVRLVRLRTQVGVAGPHVSCTHAACSRCIELAITTCISYTLIFNRASLFCLLEHLVTSLFLLFFRT